MTRLTESLLALLDDGGRPVCAQDSGRLWLSELASERAQAVPLCAACPIFTACHDAAAEHEPTFGVWAGVDRTVTTTRPGRRRTTATTKEK